MIKPLRDVLFFTPFKKENVVGGIFIPDNTGSEKNQMFVKAIVLAVGPQCVAKVGDMILVSEWKDTSKRLIDGVEMWNCRERDIVGILT